jgi:hypothetical protein
MLGQVVALLEHGGTRNVVDPADDDPPRLAAGMGIDRRDGPIQSHGVMLTCPTAVGILGPMRIISGALLMAMLGVACTSIRLALPTDPGWRDPTGCRGVGLDGVLRSSISDSRLFWMEDRDTGQRVELIWPAGYYARDDFGLEVVDGSNTFVGKAGDLVTGACVVSPLGNTGQPFHVSAEELEQAP